MNKTRYILLVIFDDCNSLMYEFFDEADLMNFIMDLNESENKPGCMSLAYENKNETKWW